MPMFSDLTKDSGLSKLNAFLADKSYIEGYVPSQADVAVLASLAKSVDAKKYPHVSRWSSHIKAISEKKAKWPKASREDYVAADGSKDEDDEDVDLFGSEDEEEEEEKKRVKEEALKAYAAKKAKKPAVIAKTSVLLDVKPWDDETDMSAMLAGVKKIEMDGLVWGASKLVPVGYGINKLQVMCTVEDEKVSIDELQEKIAELEDFVQSVDIAAMNKI